MVVDPDEERDNMGRDTAPHLEAVDGGASDRQPTRTSLVMPATWREFVEKEARRHTTSLSQVILMALAEYKETHYGSRSSWQTTSESDGDYDPKRFYTRASDKKGHFTTLRVNVPNTLVAQLANLANDRRIPQYRSLEDIVRDGTYHRAKQVALSVDDEDLNHAVDMAMLISDEINLMEKEKQGQEFVEAVQVNASRMAARGEWDALKKYLAEREAYLDSLPRPWNEELEGLIADHRARMKRKT